MIMELGRAPRGLCSWEGPYAILELGMTPIDYGVE